MEIQRDEHGKKGAFFIEEDGEWVAEMTYVRSGKNEITIDHTEVDPKLRGKDVGKELVAEGAKFARENNLKIKATCTYAKHVLSSKPEFEGLLTDQ